MTKTKRKLIDYHDLTEHRKDKILEYIRVKGISILDASLKLNVTHRTINRIFTERFSIVDKRIKELTENKQN